MYVARKPFFFVCHSKRYVRGDTKHTIYLVWPNRHHFELIGFQWWQTWANGIKIIHTKCTGFHVGINCSRVQNSREVWPKPVVTTIRVTAVWLLQVLPFTVPHKERMPKNIVGLANHANPVRQGKTSIALKRSNQRRQPTIPSAKPDLQRCGDDSLARFAPSVLLLATSHLRC